MTKTALLLRDVTRQYGTIENRVDALNGVNLAVNHGEYVAVVGPSGAGKSSLLNIIGCLDLPSGGELAIDARAVPSMKGWEVAQLRNERIGFVFQSFNLIPSLTAAGNVELPLVYAGVPRRERGPRVAEALARVGLAERAHHRPNQLSGGQQQRVAVARAIINRPTFILADEPTGNLDSVATEEVLRIFDDIHALGGTIVIITHEDDVAARAQRVLVMKSGRIENDYLNTGDPE